MKTILLKTDITGHPAQTSTDIFLGKFYHGLRQIYCQVVGLRVFQCHNVGDDLASSTSDFQDVVGLFELKHMDELIEENVHTAICIGTIDGRKVIPFGLEFFEVEHFLWRILLLHQYQNNNKP